MITALFSVLEDDPSPQLIIFGLYRNLTPLTGSESILHFLIWRYALVAYTQVDTDGRAFDAQWVLTSAIRCLATKLEAYAATFRAELERHRSRGEPPPPHLLARYNKQLRPGACLTDKGRLSYEADIEPLFADCGCYSKRPPLYFTRTSEVDDMSPDINYTYPAYFTPCKWQAAFLKKELDDERVRLRASRESNRELAIRARKNMRARK